MTGSAARPAPTPRRRDPERRQRILSAGIYRHFDGKSAVLVALYDRVIDELTRGSAEILTRGLDPAATLTHLIEAHVRIVLEDRTLMRVYHSEIASLPADDSRRLR